jgi:hypothetical protein
MLITHEVAHALETPVSYAKHINEYPADERSAFSSVLNVVEDARIDKLIQRKFPGVKAWYRQGQIDIKDMDIFDLEEGDRELSLVNRLNLHFKSNFLIDSEGYGISFTDKENEYIERMEKLETFDDVVRLAKELYEIDKSMGGAGATTDRQLEQFMEGAANQWIIDVAELPHITKPHIVPFTALHLYRTPKTPDRKYTRQINYLVSEFQRRQRARESYRSKEYTTGTINTNKLYNYLVDENIFLTNVEEHKGKNHGFVMMVDLSFSMNSVIHSVLDQLYILVVFCKKLQIPFEVYGFSDSAFLNLQRTIFGLHAVIELVSSKNSMAEIDRRFGLLRYTNQLPMNGTPLTAALATVRPILHNFRKCYGVDKLQLIMLTDGGCNIMAREGSYLADKETRSRLKTGDSFVGDRNDYTSVMFKLIRDSTGALITNFYIRHGMRQRTDFVLTKDKFGLDYLFEINQKVFGPDNNSMFLMRQIAETLG